MPRIFPQFNRNHTGRPLRCPGFAALALFLVPIFGMAQEVDRLFPARSLLPTVLAGPRDPVTSATALGVFRNPNQHGNGVEVEVSLGTSFPVYLISGTPDAHPVVVGIEAAAFARFGLQVLERELVATDWIFALPVIWHHKGGWTRFRYYHSSSHMGDEYARRFQDPGYNFSRDAAEVFIFRRPTEVMGVWAGVRYGYNVHPEDDQRWVVRAGAQLENLPDMSRSLPFLATDVEWDQEAGMRPRVEVRIGGWLPRMEGERRMRLSFLVLTGPTPLGQFGFRPITQVGLSLQGSL